MAKKELIALGLIYSAPCHAYALNEAIEEMGLEQWTNISKASVYNALARLEEQGCLKFTTQKVGKMPERKVYAITEAGKQRLLQELREHMLLPVIGDNTFYLAMTFSFGMPAEEAIEILEMRICNLSNVIENLKQQYENVKKYDMYNSMILVEAGRKHIEVEIETAKKFVKLFKKQADYYNENLTEMFRAMIQSKS